MNIINETPPPQQISGDVTSSVIADFVNAMRSAGVNMDCSGGHPIADGKIHRADAVGKRSKKNAHIFYVLHLDGVPAGAFGDLQLGIEDTWCAKKPSDLTDAEKRALRDRMKKAQEERAAKAAAMHKAAAAASLEIWKAAKKADPSHAYLAGKGLPVFPGLRVLTSNVRYVIDPEEETKTAYAGNLVVPMVAPGGDMVGAQLIQPSGKKLFVKGTAKEGNYHPVGKPPAEPDGVIIISEGYATAARLHQATGYLSIAAFDAGNLLPVGKAIRKKYPEARIVFAADNDRMTVKPVENPGVTKAREAAAATSGVVAVPQFEEGDITRTDFDDLAQQFGLDRVRADIEAALNPPADAASRFDVAALSGDLTSSPAAFEHREQGEDHTSFIGGRNPAPVPLGHDDGIFYYMVPGRGQVQRLSAAGHTSAALVGLAPLQYWEVEFPGKKGVDWTAAANAMIRECERCGVFDPSRSVGRGVMLDRGRVIAHLGDRLLVDGITAPLGLPRSQWIYSRRTRIDIEEAKPLSSEEGREFCELLTRLPWAQPDMGKLLAGAIAVAGICGALSWRSHIWINGERGSGKSWVMESIVGRVLDGLSVAVQGETTEAGVRQALRGDILPVLFDEIEGKGTDEDRRRVGKVLALARQASSSNGAPIMKGSVGGSATAYRVRSSFIFASIEKSGTHAADESRIVTLSLTHPGPHERPEDKEARSEAFSRLRDDVDRLITLEFGARLFLRSLSMVETINKNAETFAAEIAKLTGSKRLGDTLAQPLAGWLSLQSQSLISAETAADRLRSWTWLGGALARGKTEADHDAAFTHLMQSNLRLDGGIQRTVDELISTVIDDPEGVLGSQYEDALNRSGIRVKRPDNEDGRTLLILANKHPALDDLFRGQPFTLQTLRQMPGAQQSKNPVRFRGLAKIWAHEFDISQLFGSKDRVETEEPGHEGEIF